MMKRIKGFIVDIYSYKLDHLLLTQEKSIVNKATFTNFDAMMDFTEQYILGSLLNYIGVAYTIKETQDCMLIILAKGHRAIKIWIHYDI